MFTIKSLSSEGTYYLVNHWSNARTFWKLGSEMKREDFFIRAMDAKSSLTKLLKIMSEYRSDIFSIVEVGDDGKIISEMPLSGVKYYVEDECKSLVDQIIDLVGKTEH